MASFLSLKAPKVFIRKEASLILKSAVKIWLQSRRYKTPGTK